MRKLSMADLKRLTVEETLSAPKLPFVVVLDNIRSMLNVGSVFRTADAFAAEKLYLCGITGQPPHREIQKTALGSEDTVSWVYDADAAACVKALKAAGYVIISLEQTEGSVAPADLSFVQGQQVALVLGNEVNGVHQAIIDQSDLCLEIPQYGHKHSLNVSVAAGIAMWELAEKLKALH